MRRLALACVLLLPSTVLGHGGPPMSEQIVMRGAQLVVPTYFWGVFLGTDGGPWRWICEEVINQDQARLWAMAGDGTYHVTDYQGVTSSRDGGCTWVAATGEIASRTTVGLVADPANEKRAWAVTSEGKHVPWNALFRTDDDGVTWTPAMQADEYLTGPALSPDGRTIYVVGVARTGSALTLHVSQNGGMSFTDSPLVITVDGMATSVVEPLAVDASDPSIAYVRVRTDFAGQLLFKGTNYGAAWSEQFRLDGVINNVAFDAPRKAVLVAVGPSQTGAPKAGLMRSVNGGSFSAFSDLSRAQCVTVSGDKVYACSWNFAPDQKAVARSDDGGEHFQKVFQYVETVGPIETCPMSTPVGRECPHNWEMYADQLGISLARDAGTDAGTAPPMKSCASAPGAMPPRASAMAAMACLIAGAIALRQRRRGRARSR